MKKTLHAAILSAVMAAPAFAGEASWIHVRVDEEKSDGAKVAVNLPLGLLDVALDAVKHEAVREGRIELGKHDLKVADLKRLWNELKRTGDAELVRVEQKQESVRIERRGDRVLVRVTEQPGGREKVRVDLPLRVVDALFEGEGESLDLRAAVAELRRENLGELIKVDDGKSRVRIWIDDQPGS